MDSLRSSRKARLWIIGILIVVVAVLFFVVKGTWAKAILGVVMALLLAALGMEVAQTDYDLGKVVETGSFSQARIERDGTGNLINVDAFCNASERDYNCSDFRTQAEAMTVYDRCKALGANMEVYGLDRDGDGKVCESLPVGAR